MASVLDMLRKTWAMLVGGARVVVNGATTSPCTGVLGPWQGDDTTHGTKNRGQQPWDAPGNFTNLPLVAPTSCPSVL